MRRVFDSAKRRRRYAIEAVPVIGDENLKGREKRDQPKREDHQMPDRPHIQYPMTARIVPTAKAIEPIR
jgi:hypothetical protein